MAITTSSSINVKPQWEFCLVLTDWVFIADLLQPAKSPRLPGTPQSARIACCEHTGQASRPTASHPDISYTLGSSDGLLSVAILQIMLRDDEPDETGFGLLERGFKAVKFFRQRSRVLQEVSRPVLSEAALES